MEKTIAKELNRDVDETVQINGQSRLSCFQSVTQVDCSGKDEETMSESDLSLVKTEDSSCPLTRTGSFIEKEGRAMDFEMWSQGSLEVCE